MIPKNRKLRWGDHGAHWPHRYIEKKFWARLKHEWKLMRGGFTNWELFLMAMCQRAPEAKS
jgi:hypothetical protein